MTPYYDDGTCVIYHGDCREVLPTLAEFDLVFTSPPYNMGGGATAGRWHAAAKLGHAYQSYGDDMPQDEYDAWQRWVVAECWRHLSDDGAIFYNHKPRVQNGVCILPTSYGDPSRLRQVITWDRSTGLNFNDSYFLPKSEWIVVWAKPSWRLVERKACEVGDVWRFRPESSQQHPAPFPIELPLRAIGSTPAAAVLDPFMGSGTTLRAAKDLGRKAVGIELSEAYCEIAAKRLAQEVLDFGGAA